MTAPIYRVFKITAGDVTVEFNGEPFALRTDGYAPAYPVRGGKVSGKGTYANVTEAITFDIYSMSTMGVLTAGVRNLTQVLDLIDAWKKKESDVPVIFHIKPQHSDLDVDSLQSLIMGHSGVPVNLPASYHDLISIEGVQEIGPITIEYERRGLLLGELQTAENTTPVTVPSIITAGGLDEEIVNSPTKVSLVSFAPGNTPLGDGFLLMTGEPINSVNGVNFGLFDASDMTSSDFSSVDDSANKAYNDDIMQINAATKQTGEIEIDLECDFEALLVYLTYRNDHATTTWRIRARSSGYVDAYTRWTVIDAESTNPRPIALGVLRSAAKYHQKLHIEVETDANVGTLGINAVATLPVSEQSHAIDIVGKTYTPTTYTHDLVVDHKALEDRRALAYLKVTQ